MPVVYGCETESSALREEHTLRVHENRVMRNTFGPKREWKRLNNERLYDLYPSPNIRAIESRRM